MAKISELGPITGANTRSEDLFVIVNLIQGDDGTKNITRKELVQAIQYEIFDRITITGGTISGVVMSNSIINNVVINDSTINRATINDSTFDNGAITNSTGDNLTIVNSSFDDGTADNVDITNSTFTDGDIFDSNANNVSITNSSFNDGTADNVDITNSTFTDGDIFNSNANNVIITNSEFNDGTGNNVVLTNSTIDNSAITNSSFNDGTADNVDITNSTFNDGTADNVDITNSTFNNGTADSVIITNSEFNDGTADNVDITNSTFNNGTADNVIITNSEFNDGTGNNVTLTNSTIDDSTFSNGLIEDSVIANTQFQGGLTDVTIERASIIDTTITSSSANTFSMSSSTFENGNIENSTFNEGQIRNSDMRDSNIIDSTLTDFELNLTKRWEPEMLDESYFAIKNAKTGETERINYRQFFDEIARSTEKASKIYVAVDGDDKYQGTILQPVRTLERATEIALEKAGGSYNRNALNNAIHISCGPGTYYTKGNVALPDDCSLTSTGGQYTTVIEALPGYEKNNAILVGSGCYVQGFSYTNWQVDNFDYPEGGFAIAYRPGAKMLRSPYIRDSSQLSNFKREDVEPPLQPFNSKGTVADLGQELFLTGISGTFTEGDEVTFSSGAFGYISWDQDVVSDSRIYVRNLKGNVEVGDYVYAESGGVGQISTVGIDDFPNPLVGRGGGCVLADRRVLDPDSLYTYVLTFGFTPRTQNGVGYVARDGAGINGIGSLSIFVREAFYALNGGQVTLNNSGTQFGDISMRAKGTTTVFAPAAMNEDLLLQNTTFGDTLEDNSPDIIEDMVEYLVANTANGGLGYQAYDSDKCKRDTGIIVDSVGYDVALNTNYWGRLNGITYRSPISQIVYGEQLTETIGAINHLQEEVEYIFRNANSSIIDRANTSFTETINILQNGEPYASELFFEDTGIVGRTAARELIQTNRDFIIDELVDWIEDNPEFFAYDSSKCRRDIQEYILPAVKNDMLLDTNYNAVTAGNAYYMGTARKVIGNQREETVAAYKKLRQDTDKLIEGTSSAGAVAAYDSFDEIIHILDNAGKTFTPTAANYNPVTGVLVINIGEHNLTVGRSILIAPESMIFTCDSDNNQTELAHPRVTDPIYKRPIKILAVTASTITVNVGESSETSEHNFVRATPNSISLVGSELYFSDNINIDPNRVNARKQLQANKTYIQDYMLGWINDNYFIYDSDKCRRDTSEYILPAVQRDLVTGTNFNAIQTGVAYYQATASEVIDDQLTQTVGAINYLREDVANTITGDAASILRTDEAFDKITSIMQNAGRTYTPTDASYNPTTGVMQVTIGEHDFQVGDRIKIAPESMTFECGSPAVQITHPRPTDPIYNQFVTITSITSTTITVNVGDAGGYTGAHTFISANSNAIRGEYTGSYTPLDATYDPVNGEMVIEIGNHSLQRGDWIQFAPESITFECDSPAVQITHPRPTDPAYDTAIRVHDTSNTSISVYVGNAGGYTGAHTFVSADVGAVKTNGIVWTDPSKVIDTYTPTDATYDPATGAMTITLGDHNMQTGDFVELMPYGITFSCGANNEFISHPRVSEPNYGTPVEITGTGATSITLNVGTAGGYTGAHTFEDARSGSVVHTQSTTSGVNARRQLQTNRQFIQDEVIAYLEDNFFVYDADKCARDTGLILDAVRRDILTGSNFNAVFAGLSYRSGNASANVVVTEQLTETVGSITWLKGEIGSNLTGNSLTRSNAAFDEIIDIMNNGQGSADTIDFGTAYVSEAAYEARLALQNNKVFLQEEITAWIAENYPTLTYDVAKCERDLGYLIDSVSYDIQHGSNIASINNARLYYDNAVGVLPDDQKVPTAAAFLHIADLAKSIVRGQPVVKTTGNPESANTAEPNGFTPTDADYNPITGVMEITIGSHDFAVGDKITIDEAGITFECGSPAVQISHPRPTDPAFNAALRIQSVTSTTITVNVGDANGYTGAHTFVSATDGAVKRSSLDIAETTRGLFKIVADLIVSDDFSEEYNIFDFDDAQARSEFNKTQFADVFDQLPLEIEPNYSANTSGYGVEYYNSSIYINGAKGKYQDEIIAFIRDTYNGLAFNRDKCHRDTGYIVDAISQDIEYGGNEATVQSANAYFTTSLEYIERYPERQTRPEVYRRYIEEVNLLPFDQRGPTKAVYTHIADIVDDVITETPITPTTGNPSSQDTTGTPGDAATGLAAKNLLLEIANVVDIYSKPDDLPTITGQPSVSPKNTYARQQIMANKRFLTEEVIAYLNDKYFTYDGEKCSRDTGYILDAVKRDIVTESNFNSIFTGLSYRSGTVGANIVIDDQLGETVEGIQYLKEEVGKVLTSGAKTKSDALFDKIIEIMSKGTGTTIDYGTAFLALGDSASRFNASEQLKNNTAFLKAEITEWIATNHGSLVYDVAKCERDVGYLIDSVRFDILHGSNAGVVNNARVYFENAVSTLPADQRTPTAEAFEYLASIAEQVVQDTPVSALQLVVSQDFTAGDAGVIIGQTVQDLFNVVSSVILADSLVDLPAISEPAGYETEYQSAVTRINLVKSDLQRTIITHLAQNVNGLAYNEAKCRRDTGYIIDALAHDLQYGGNAAMVNAAGIYFENAVNVLPFDQRGPTKAAFDRLAECAEKIIFNDDITPSPYNTETQIKTLIPGANPMHPEVANRAKSLVNIVSSIADDSNPNNIAVRVDPIVTWVSDNYKSSKELIESSTETLIEDMIQYISDEYNGLSFPTDRCRRDMGFIVDAISHDIQYGGNYATRINAQIYFENGISVLPVDTRLQTAEVYEHMGVLMSDIAQEVDTTNASYANTGVTYTTTPQDFSNDPATAVEGSEIINLVGIIESVIRNDSISVIPELENPNTAWVDSTIVDASVIIDNNEDELADNVIDYLKEEFTVLDYNKSKCKRDTGYLLDAFSFDLNYGGNAASRWNADFYYWNNIYRIPEDQRLPTALSYRRLGEICKDIVVGKYPGQKMYGELGTQTEADKVYSLGDIFYQSQFWNDTSYLPKLDLPDFDYNDDQIYKFARDILVFKRTTLQKEVVRFVNAEYDFVDINLTRRDGLNLLKAIANDFRFINTASGEGGSQKQTRTYTAAFFNFEGKHVFPVFNPPIRGLKFQGTTQSIPGPTSFQDTRKFGHAYIVSTNYSGNRYVGDIYYWSESGGGTWVNAGPNNTNLLDSFYEAWIKMRDYIIANYSPDADHTAMLNGLFNDCLIGNVLRPPVIAFGSLVESIAHQFNGASAGVNRTALPLNFRNLGLPISALASVLSEDGGRVRWSGADELNNQYFARGLRINGRTGRIEGRPFTSSVRKLARRASNSRAVV